MRFHFRILYDGLETSLIANLRKYIGTPLDLVWSFEPNRFVHLKKFRASKVIFHPVDSHGHASQRRPAREADLVFSVSKTILAPFLNQPAPAILVPHGLAPAFATLANNGEDWKRSDGPLKVGVTGNFLRPIVARSVMLSLMKRHPEVEFHLWGQSEPRPDADPRSVAFIMELKGLPNCKLRGIKPTEVLAAQFLEMDIFLLAYQAAAGEKEFDFSNSHKILEYLSTGRVTLSSPLSEYEDHDPEVVLFAEGNVQEAFEGRFEELLANLDHFNGPVLAKLRRGFALQNCYSTHWEMIENKLNFSSEAIMLIP